MQRCTERRNAWLCDGSIRPLARARSTSICASSAPTRSAAATSSGPSSGLSDDTSSVSSTGSSTPAQPLDQREPGRLHDRHRRRLAVGRRRPRRSRAAAGTAARPSTPSAPARSRLSVRRRVISVGDAVDVRGLSAPSDTTGFSRSMAVASVRSAGVVRERFGGDDDRRRGIGDQLAEAVEFRVVEQMRVVDHDRRAPIVAAPRRSGQHRHPGCRAAPSGSRRAPSSYRCRCRRTPAP